MERQFKVALPKGRLLTETARLLQRAGWGLSGYHEGIRAYRLKSPRFPNLLAKVFHERDIPIQVAVGNYDLGICGLDWIEELLIKYPSSSLVKLTNLGYGDGSLSMVTSSAEALTPLEESQTQKEIIRLASEYPNLAESFALSHRLRRFSIFPLWGAAEAYPPENADLVLLSRKVKGGIFEPDLTPIGHVLSFSAYLIANKDSWERKDLSEMLASINRQLSTEERPLSAIGGVSERIITRQYPPQKKNEAIVRLALPDGHQQQPTLELLTKANIRIEDYPSADGNRRPISNLDGVAIKVIRPQDMPLQVANSNFDLAITGQDWLREHHNQFPSSPVTEVLDLKFGKVRIVAVVSKDLLVDDIYSLKQLYAEQSIPLRVASEYTNIADKYARDNHFGEYKIIPTWGASEAFLPEDADLLIENTQTGRTIARHNLKIIDTLFESTACLVGNKESILNPVKAEKIKSIIETLQAAVSDS